MIHRNTVSYCKALEGKVKAFIGSLWPEQHIYKEVPNSLVSSSLCGIIHSDQVVQRLGQLIHCWIPCQIPEPIPVTNNNPVDS